MNYDPVVVQKTGFGAIQVFKLPPGTDPLKWIKRNCLHTAKWVLFVDAQRQAHMYVDDNPSDPSLEWRGRLRSAPLGVPVKAQGLRFETDHAQFYISYGSPV